MVGYYNGNAPYYGAGMPYGGYSAAPYYGYGAQTPQHANYGNVMPSYHNPYAAVTHKAHQRQPGAAGAQRRALQPVSQYNADHSSRAACELCNLVFNSPSELSEHVDELHVTCEVEGCGFSAPLDMMAVHNLKHVKNEKGESVLESPEETWKWIENRRNRHPLNRRRNMAVVEDSTLERLLREAHRKHKSDSPAKSALYPIISKVRDRPSALLHLSEPLKYRNLVRQSFGPYSYRPSLSMGHSICQTYRRTRTCKFGDRCQYSHDLKGGCCREFCVTKRPPTLLHVLKKDIYSAEKTLVNAIKTIVSLDFFDADENEAVATDRSSENPPSPVARIS